VPNVVKDADGLTDQWREFAHRYVEHWDQQRAVIEAGFSENGTKQTAYRLMKRPEIRAYVNKLIEKRNERADLSADQIVNELRMLACYDLTEVLIDSEDGNAAVMQDPRKLPEDLRRAIVKMKSVPLADGKIGYELTFADKLRALEMLARHLQMFKETLVIENVISVVRGMDDSDLDRRLAELERIVAEAANAYSSPGAGAAAIH